MFLGFLDPDPLVRGMDPDPSIIKKNLEEKLRFLLFCDFFWTFFKWSKWNVPSKSNKLKNFFLKLVFSWRLEGIRIHYSEAWIHGSRSGTTPKCYGSATPGTCGARDCALLFPGYIMPCVLSTGVLSPASLYIGGSEAMRRGATSCCFSARDSHELGPWPEGGGFWALGGGRVNSWLV
jgi:hypothetical protein